MTLEEQFKQETGQDARCITTDGIHAVGIEVYRFDYVAWLEKRASRDKPTAPSERCKELIKQTGEMFDLFKEENIGRYELTQARVALFKARDYLEVFEQRRGIAK